MEASLVASRADNLADTAQLHRVDTALHRKEDSLPQEGKPVGNPVAVSMEARRVGSVLPHRVDTAQRHNRITRHRVTLATLTDGSSHLHPERTDEKSATNTH